MWDVHNLLLPTIHSRHLLPLTVVHSRFIMESLDITDIKDLELLLRFHSSLSDGSHGFRLCIARRLLTLSLEDEGLEEAQARLDTVREIACLRATLLQRLQKWLQYLPSSTSFSAFSMSEERFLLRFEREFNRLNTKKPEVIIRNTV